MSESYERTGECPELRGSCSCGRVFIGCECVIWYQVKAHTARNPECFAAVMAVN